MSYIEREPLLEKVKSIEKQQSKGDGYLPNGAVLECKMEIVFAPSVDVVEVVRCKDCMYFTGKDYDGCCIKNGLATRYANDFCSYGERREE